jgi:CheY-like chemotaxis protein
MGDENGGKLIILVAEDNADDAMLLEHAFRKNGIDLPVHVCTDGEDTLRYLKGEGRYANRAQFPFPRVIITDLKMPRCDGFQVLQWLQDHPECNLIPKFVFSASAQEEDVVRAYQLGANSYFRKPSTLGELVDLVRITNAFWTAATLPPLPEKC